MTQSSSGQRGQALIIMVFLLIGLLAFVGLAIDGGTVYLERRRMQNAADAGSLAGTRVLAQAMCGDDSPSTTDAEILGAVQDFVVRNGMTDPSAAEVSYVKFDGADVVEFSPQVLVGNGSVPVGAAGVAVTSHITRPTFFLRLVGQATGAAQAAATAVTGPPMILAGGGIRPFGIPEDIVQNYEPWVIGTTDSCVTASFKHCDVSHPDDCWIKNDEGDVIGHHRNWMNFNYVWNQGEHSDYPRAIGGAGASDLKAWMRDGSDDMFYADSLWYSVYGDFIHAKPGTDAAVVPQVPIGLNFAVPIYDVIAEYDEIITDVKADPESQGGSWYYHVVGFATVNATSYNQGAGTIRICLTHAIVSQGVVHPSDGYGSGADACPTGTMAVELAE